MQPPLDCTGSVGEGKGSHHLRQLVHGARQLQWNSDSLFPMSHSGSEQSLSALTWGGAAGPDLGLLTSSFIGWAPCGVFLSLSVLPVPWHAPQAPPPPLQHPACRGLEPAVCSYPGLAGTGRRLCPWAQLMSSHSLLQKTQVPLGLPVSVSREAGLPTPPICWAS